MLPNAALSAEHPSTSPSLLARAKTADPSAWQRLCELYTPLVYTWCRRADFPADTAADVLQEVFQAVYQHIGRFEHNSPGTTFRGWLWTITRSKICDYFRVQKGQPAAKGGTTAHRQLLELPEREPSPADADTDFVGDRVLLEGLETARAEFEPRTWQAFWRLTVEGRPAADAAAELGMSVNAVRTAKCRVLRRLRQQLGELIGQDE